MKHSKKAETVLEKNKFVLSIIQNEIWLSIQFRESATIATGASVLAAGDASILEKVEGPPAPEALAMITTWPRKDSLHEWNRTHVNWKARNLQNEIVFLFDEKMKWNHLFFKLSNTIFVSWNVWWIHPEMLVTSCLSRYWKITNGNK